VSLHLVDVDNVADVSEVRAFYNFRVEVRSVRVLYIQGFGATDPRVGVWDWFPVRANGDIRQGL
jgi:hypothetical protein